MRSRIDIVENGDMLCDAISVKVIWESGNEDLVEIDFGGHKEWVFRVCDDSGGKMWEEVWVKSPVEFLREKKLDLIL
jgi:hypothetical protein